LVRAVTHCRDDVAGCSCATECGYRERAHVTRMTVRHPARYAAVRVDVPADDLEVSAAVANCSDDIRRVQSNETDFVNFTGLSVFMVESGQRSV
jgi:glutamate dehydrogenase/leucine dehydrogenase